MDHIKSKNLHQSKLSDNGNLYAKHHQLSMLSLLHICVDIYEKNYIVGHWKSWKFGLCSSLVNVTRSHRFRSFFV